MSGPLVELRREGATAVLMFRREAKLNAIRRRSSASSTQRSTTPTCEQRAAW